MKIGILCMSAKPFHVGHMMAVEKAAAMCDEVHLLVSLSDRIKKGEFPIYGEDMAVVWKEQLEGIMPGNVTVDYVKSPVASAYALAGEIDKDGDGSETVLVFGDAEDLSRNFPSTRLEKYFPTLTVEDRIELVPTARFFSGTKMRAMLARGDKEGFEAKLPNGIDKDFVWSLLSRRRNENLTYFA